MGEIAVEHRAGLLLHLAHASGSAEDREVGAGWMARRFGDRIDPELVVIANGTQSLVRLLFERFVKPGGVALAEELSYGVVRNIAELSRIRLHGLPIDRDGIVPDAIEPIVKRTGARVLYCNPTVQNPTAAIMPRARREEIARLAGRLGLIVVEDDVLGPLHPDAPPPIAAFAPDRVWYIQSTTKTLAHGLRIAYARAPSVKSRDTVLEPVRRLSFWAPAPLGLAVLTRWIENGVAADLLAAIRREATLREAAARRVLSAFGAESVPGGFHIWLPTGGEGGTAFASRAAAGGVIVRPGRHFFVGPRRTDPPFVRLSISSPTDRADFQLGLMRVRKVRAGS